MKKGSDLLVSALENEGVDRIFGVRGEENLDVVESLRTSKIKLILPRHEQAAAFMAATHGRLTGKPGVCISTLGPGALNFSTGAPTQYTAYHVAVPFLSERLHRSHYRWARKSTRCFHRGSILGVLQSFAVLFFSAGYKDIVAFSVLLIFLFLRPAGLFGSLVED